MDDDDFNLIKILKAETNVALPALKEVFENMWNNEYPDTKWTNDLASVTQFDQRDEERFQKILNGLPNGQWRMKIAKRKQFITLFKDEEWQSGNWDISKLGYALIDSKLFQLDEADDAHIPIGEHIAEIRNIRNRSAHHTNSRCSKEDCENTLTMLGKHIKAFKVLDIDVDRYVEMIECIRSEEAPLSSRERYILQLELKVSNQIYEQKEKTYEEIKKRCELQDRIIAMQTEHSKEVECLKGQLELKKLELLNKSHEVEMVKFTHKEEIRRMLSENATKRHKEEVQNKQSIYQNIQSEISSGVLMLSKTKSSSLRNRSSDEQLVSSETRRARFRNMSKRKARSMDLGISKITISFDSEEYISFDSEEIRSSKIKKQESLW